MLIPKSKLKMLSSMLRPKGLEDVLQIGNLKTVVLDLLQRLILRSFN